MAAAKSAGGELGPAAANAMSREGRDECCRGPVGVGLTLSMG